MCKHGQTNALFVNYKTLLIHATPHKPAASFPCALEALDCPGEEGGGGTEKRQELERDTELAERRHTHTLTRTDNRETETHRQTERKRDEGRTDGQRGDRGD